MKRNADGSYTGTPEEFAALEAAKRMGKQPLVQAIDDEDDGPDNPAPTRFGREYHNWRAERDAAAAEAWDEMGDISPFGGGFCRFCGSIARGLSQHHRRGGFFSGR